MTRYPRKPTHSKPKTDRDRSNSSASTRSTLTDRRPPPELGWDRDWERAFLELAEPKWSVARVAVEQRGRYRLIGGETELWARPSGKARHEAADPRDLPAVGDFVAYDVQHGGAIVHAVLPRRSALVRRAAGRRAEPQVVASNVDTVFVVTTPTLEFNARRIERFLTAVIESGAQPVLLLNKADLTEDPQDYLDELEAIAADTPLALSVATAGVGMELLQPWLRSGQTIALLGASGVGKSTLINALSGAEVQKTAPIRDGDHRGRHTTRQRELFRVAGGAMLIDTPGLREFEAWELTDGLQDSFSDVAELAERCRFRDCRHLDEPECAVNQAVDDGKLDPFRLDNFHRLLEEAENRKRHWDRDATTISRERISSTTWSKKM